MSDKRILFVAQEIAPYLPANNLSTLGNTLAQGMQERGFEVRTFMPRYGCINERRNQLHEVIRLSGMNIIINDTDHPLIIKVASLQPSRIQVYFIDNDDYFQKSTLDADPVGSNREDNDERSIFFARGTIETVKKLRWDPTIVHCQGWISAFIPIYLRSIYKDDPAFKDSKIIYNILPGAFDGVFPASLSDKLKFDSMPEATANKFSGGDIDIMSLHKLIIEHADGVISSIPDLDPTISELIEKMGIPFLPYEKANEGADAYAEFYNSFIPNND